MEGGMARPKSAFLKELAERADADLKRVDAGGLATKLKAISAVATDPVATVARVMKVSAQTVLRWVGEYREGGLDGLRPKPKRPRRSKLDAGQKETVLSWLDEGRTAGGEEVHWTLGRLSAAVAEEFGVALAPSTIWFWLRREGWRQRVPRPRHHQSDAAAQEGFKKKPRS
jgi:transposase